MAERHDSPIMKWKENVQKYHESSNMVITTTSGDETRNGFDGDGDDDTLLSSPLHSVQISPIADVSHTNLKRYDITGDNCDFEQRPSQYSSVKDTKSIHGFCMIGIEERIQLGFIDKNENITHEMVEILRLINRKYIPTIKEENGHEEEIKERLLFGGDQLTVERSIGAMGAVMDAETPFKQLKGIIPKVEDFHCEMNVLQLRLSELTCKCLCHNKFSLCKLVMQFIEDNGINYWSSAHVLQSGNINFARPQSRQSTR
ncbi:hypothetical protein QZH41_003986 [Actinostola sp. cb2023]|nr:hypothetical protein QZH41_003986 [Actinostola sp. cb2023]